MCRWLDLIQEYSFAIEHRPGCRHSNADGLSRSESLCRQCNVTAETYTITDSQPATTKGINACSVKQQAIEDIDEDLANQPLAVLQKNDPDIAPVFMAMLHSESAPSPDAYTAASDITKAYFAQWNLLTIKDDVIYRKWIDEHRQTLWLQCLIPRCLVTKVLSDCHAGVTGGHFATKKTLEQINRRAYWLKWRSDTTRFCKRCSECNAYHRGKAPKHGEMQTMLVGAPMERLGIDLCGPFPTSEGHKYILTTICHFTRWAEAIPIPNKEAHTVATALVNNVISRFGTPIQILSDQGRTFDNNLLSGICRALQIDKIRTTSYRPNTNGQVEILHRSINSMIGKVIGDNQHTWTELLPPLMAAYRSAVHSSTGYSPNYLTLGREVNMPIDLWLQSPDSNKYNSDDYVEAMVNRMMYAADVVRNNLQMQSTRNKRLYDIRVKSNRFRTGDWVLLFTPRTKPGNCVKWQRMYNGPFLVIDVIGPVTCIVQKSEKAHAIVTHIDKLKLYHGPTPTSWLEPHHQLLNDDDENTEASDDALGQPHTTSDKRRRQPPAWLNDYLH
jgi:transposase InsO family protein